MSTSDSDKAVKIRLNESIGQIIGSLAIKDVDFLSKELSYVIPGSQYSPQFKMGHWDGRERLLKSGLKFPRGLAQRAIHTLNRIGIDTFVEDAVVYDSIPEVPNLAPVPYPYQIDVIKTALQKRSGTIQVATGGGKSIIIAYITAALNVRTMIYVVSLELLSQLQQTLESVLGHEVGAIGGGRCKILPITVCSVWTAGRAVGEKLAKADEDEDGVIDEWSPNIEQLREIGEAVRGARLAILDESQFAAAATIRMILKNSNAAAYRYGFSATPWRSAGDDILLEAAFGEKICSISGTELIGKGYLVQPKIVFRDVPKIGKLPKKWPAVKSNYIVNNQGRNEILVKNAKKLIEMGRKPLMLFRELKHGDILYRMMSEHARCALVSGDSSDKERSDLKRKFLAGEIDVIISSSILDQGFDLPPLDALVLCGGGKSTAKALQRVGRVLRTSPASGKTDAIIVDTFDQAHYVSDHALGRYKIYKSEPGFVVKVEPEMEAFLKKQSWEQL